eukprot:4250560-Amphidinium_carterae.1
MVSQKVTRWITGLPSAHHEYGADWLLEKPYSNTDDDVSWESIGSQGVTQASTTRGFGSNQEEWDFYLETTARLQEHLHEVDVDATRCVASCQKKRFHRKLGRPRARRGGLRGTQSSQSTLPSVQEEEA